MTPDSSRHSDPDECYTDYALQEYALDRLADSIRKKIELHLEKCTSCASAAEAIQREAIYFQQLDAAIETRPDTPCSSDLELAAYLDQSVDDSQRSTIESHLASCAQCRKNLVTLYRGVQAINQKIADSPSGQPEIPEEKSKGIILTMPKRPHLDKGQELPHFLLRETGTDE